ncbi:MAG: hypothetical protein CMB64_04250 [Euryarchaeota archaeon]|nr:hypothetical protein [Euryarchaeota archaeon]
MRTRHLIVITIILLLSSQSNSTNLNSKIDLKNASARAAFECTEYNYEIGLDLPIDAAFLIEDGGCIALFINGLEGIEKLDINILGDSTYPVDSLMMDDGVYYTYLNEQQYHINPLSGTYLIEKDPSIENLTGEIEYTWAVPSNDVFVLVLDNMRHIADENRGAGGGDSVSISVSIETNNENWIWTPLNSIIQLEPNENEIFNLNPLYFDEGDAITIRSSPIFGNCDVYLMTESQYNLYTTGSPGVWNIVEASMLEISSNNQVDWTVTSEFANIPLHIVIDNQNNPAGGGNGEEKIATTIAVLVNPILSPSIQITSHNSSEIEIGELIEFDATNTPNRWGQIKEYNWNIEGFGNVSGTTADAEWETPGTYNVELEITRLDNLKEQKNISISVLDLDPPIVKISGVAEGALIEQNSKQTITCDCSDNHEIDSIEWIIDSQNNFENGVSLTLPTSELGAHELKLIITDSSGNLVEKYLNYTIVDATDPELISVNWPEGEIVQYNELVFKIKASDPEDSNLIYRWDFDLSTDSNGDGDKRNDWKLGTFDSNTNEAGISHTYQQPGTYTVMVQVLNSENRKLELTYSIAVSEEESTTNTSLIYFSGGIFLLLLLSGGIFIGWKNIQQRISDIEAQGKNLTPEEQEEIKQQQLSQELYGSDQTNLESVANIGNQSQQWSKPQSQTSTYDQIAGLNTENKSQSYSPNTNNNLGREMLNALIEVEEKVPEIKNENDDLAFLKKMKDDDENNIESQSKNNHKNSGLKIEIPGMPTKNKIENKGLKIELPTFLNNKIHQKNNEINDEFDI